MIDRLLSADPRFFESDLKITSDNIFLEDKSFTAEGIIENMAQTAMAGIAYNSKLDKLTPVNGFLAGIQDFNLTKHPQINTTVRTTVTIKAQLPGMFLVYCELSAGDECIANGKLQITSN